MKKIVQEKLTWFHVFIPLYERAAPLVRCIANPEKLKAGELPISPGMLVESSLMLRPILNAVRRMPKSKEKELVTIQREFEIALYNCIKASELAEKYINSDSYGRDRQILISMIVNTTVLANEYIESVSERLAPYVEQ